MADCVEVVKGKATCFFLKKKLYTLPLLILFQFKIKINIQQAQFKINLIIYTVQAIKNKSYVILNKELQYSIKWNSGESPRDR